MQGSKIHGNKALPGVMFDGFGQSDIRFDQLIQQALVLWSMMAESSYQPVLSENIQEITRLRSRCA